MFAFFHFAFVIIPFVQLLYNEYILSEVKKYLPIYFENSDCISPSQFSLFSVL